MKIWIFLNGRQEGPYTLEQLADMPIDEDTKVWFDGLPKWYPAGSLAELRPLFDGSFASDEQPHRNSGEETEIPGSEEIVENTAQNVETVIVEDPVVHTAIHIREQGEPCPPTYLGWAIVLTICCCSPLSIAAIVTALIVSSAYNSGNIEKARRYSEITAWLVMAALALGFIPAMLMISWFGN